MSFHSNLENGIPDSVRTLGQLESIEEEEEIFSKPIIESASVSHLKNVITDHKKPLDKENTLFFRSAVFGESPHQLGKLTDSLESQDDSSYKLVGIDGDVDSDEDSASSYISSVISTKPNTIDRSNFVVNLNDITNGTENIALTVPNTPGELQADSQEKHKKSKWRLFFKNSKSKNTKEAKADKKRTSSVSDSSTRKFFQKLLLPRGKSFVAPLNQTTIDEKIIEKSKLKEAETKHLVSKSIQSETQRFEREYKILSQIGSGGHSVVNLAIRKSDDKKVVAKQIQCVSVWHWNTDDRGDDDLPLEVYMLQKFAKSNYPGIIKYYDHFDMGSQFVIIMEYLGEDWMDLYDYIENFGPVREKDANEIFTRVVSVVCYLHNSGYCHNDIKDENIMINAKTRQIKLIDFGSLTYLRSGVTHNTFYGTRKFQSPEAIRGTYLLEYQEVWALGTLYYVLLFKMDPFKNDDEVLQVDIKRRMERIRHFGVDGMLINITDEAVLSISKMLDRDWTKRPKVCEILSLPAFKKK